MSLQRQPKKRAQLSIDNKREICEYANYYNYKFPYSNILLEVILTLPTISMRNLTLVYILNSSPMVQALTSMICVFFVNT